MEKAVSNAQRHAQISDPAVQRKLTLALCFIIFFSVLNGTMFNVSIPDIAKQFRLLPSQVSWVVSGYIILFALGSVTYGKLADSRSVRDLITIGLVLFSAGSLIGFTAGWYPMLVIGRVVQASGSGAIPALAMLVATRYFPSDIRGRALGVIGSTVAFAGGIGPMLGGFITSAFHWRYLFLFTPATLLAVPLLRRLIPFEISSQDRFDKIGAALIAGTTACLLLFITLADWRILAFGAALAAWFILHIRRAEAPFVSPALFQNRKYRNTIISGFLTTGTVFGMMFMTPIMLRSINDLHAGRIGMVMFPGAMTAAFLGTFAGRMSDRKGSVPVVRAGQVFLIIGYAMLSTFAGRDAWIVTLNLIVCYSGFSFIQASLAHTVSGTLAREQMGIGMGMYNLFLFMSGAFSAAIIGKAIDLTRGHAPLNPLAAAAAAGPYSNLFLLLSGVVFIAAALFHRTFRKTGRTKENER